MKAAYFKEHGGARLERDRLGKRQDVAGRCLHELGVAAVLVGAEVTVADTHGSLAA